MRTMNLGEYGRSAETTTAYDPAGKDGVVVAIGPDPTIPPAEQPTPEHPTTLIDFDTTTPYVARVTAIEPVDVVVTLYEHDSPAPGVPPPQVETGDLSTPAATMEIRVGAGVGVAGSVAGVGVGVGVGVVGVGGIAGPLDGVGI